MTDRGEILGGCSTWEINDQIMSGAGEFENVFSSNLKTVFKL